jgi:3-phenylpropionate/cinnamic acid dioxygenase small subunit
MIEAHPSLLETVTAFIHEEARLADESRYAEWEALLTDDMHYWVPAGPATGDPADQLSFINDNRARLATRLAQLRTGKRHAQTPASPMRRLVCNIEIVDGTRFDADGDEVVVGANFVIYELAAQATHELRIWPGRVTYRLRRVDGAIRMAAKWIELVTATKPQPNLTFIV